MTLTSTEKKDVKNLMLLASMAGQIMLKNGAETYRVEDTIERICKSRLDIIYADAFVSPTGIMVSLEYKDEIITYMIRIGAINVNLHKIMLVNEFSRNFVNSDMSILDGINRLKKINKTQNYSVFTKALFGAWSGAFFTVLVGGTHWDFLSSYLISFFLLKLLASLRRYKLTFFINNFFGAIAATFLSILAVDLGIGKNMDTIIIGSIMCMVPGVAITNAMRDSMSGDFTSGLSRSMEAIFSALAIAFGVGVVLNFYFRRLR